MVKKYKDFVKGSTQKIPILKNSDYKKLLKLDKSDVGGVGVFAKDYINEGSVFVFDFDIVDWKTADDYTKLRLFPYSATEGSLLRNEGPFFNHSEDPALKVLKFDKKNKKMYFAAGRDIEQGEEIFISYGNKYFKKKL